MDEDWENVVCKVMFEYGAPRYEFVITKFVAHCNCCGRRFGKKDIRLRVITPNTTIIFCPTGDCCEWFFNVLLQFKRDDE